MAQGVALTQADRDAIPMRERSRGANAEEMMKRLAAGKDPHGSDETDQQQEEQHAAEGANNEQQRSDQNFNKRDESAAEEQPEKPKPEGDNWEHKYNSLRGQWDNLRIRLDNLAADNEQLRATIQNLEQRPTEEQKLVPEISAEDRAEYGEDFFAMLDKYMEPMRRENEKLKNELGSIKNTTTASASAKMHELLDKEVPNWQEVNQSDDFLGWITKTDEASGHPRRNLLLDAYKRNEGARVAYFFRTFLSEVRGEKRQEPQAQGKSDGRAPAPKADGLAKFAAPARGKSASGKPESDEPRVVSTQDISKFYADKAAGRYRGREEEADRFEQEIFSAQSEGRIR